MFAKKNEYGRLTANLYEPLLGAILKPMRAAVAACLRERGCRNALDLCCGPGGLEFFLRDSEIYALGLDLDLNMLDAARKRNPRGAFIMADAASLPFAAQSLDAAVISLALHEMPQHSADAALDEALRVAKFVIVADYRLAERNLDLPARLAALILERMVGGEHWRNYKIFMENGGLEGLLYRKKAKILQRRNALAGAAAVVTVAPLQPRRPNKKALELQNDQNHNSGQSGPRHGQLLDRADRQGQSIRARYPLPGAARR